MIQPIVSPLPGTHACLTIPTECYIQVSSAGELSLIIEMHIKNLQRTKVSVWLYDNVDCRLQGRIIGFDEYMNLILDDVEEVFINKKQSQPNSSLGRILLKGDNITLIQSV